MDIDRWTATWLRGSHGPPAGTADAALLRRIEELAGEFQDREAESDLEAIRDLGAAALLWAAHTLLRDAADARNDASRGKRNSRAHSAVEALGKTLERLIHTMNNAEKSTEKGRKNKSENDKPEPVIGLGTRMLPILKKAEGVLEECLE